MSDLIDRQQAIDALHVWFNINMVTEKDMSDHIHDLELIINHIIGLQKVALRKLPPAQQEIITCKDCKHWKIGTENLNCPNSMICSLHSFMHGFERASLPEDYCSWAERRSR